MSTAANTLASPAVKTRHKRVSGWAQLMRLLPYVSRHKGEVVIGMVTQIGMGITGTLLPLIIGAIVDCLKGAVAPLAQLGRLTQISLGFLLPYYHPRNAQTLAVFCSALIIICAIQGVFSYWTRQILIGLSRDIEYDLRNDLLNKLVVMEPEFYVRNRTGELMSRCTNDLNSVRMVLGPGIMYSANTFATMVLAVVLMFWISARLSVYVLLPVPVVAIVVWIFGQQIHGSTERSRPLSPCSPRKLRKIWRESGWCALMARRKRKSAASTGRIANISIATCAWSTSGACLCRCFRR